MVASTIIDQLGPALVPKGERPKGTRSWRRMAWSTRVPRDPASVARR